MYGVNNRKFYEEINDKNSIENLKLAGKKDDFGDREKIFEENRPALMKMIRFNSELRGLKYKYFFSYFDLETAKR